MALKPPVGGWRELEKALRRGAARNRGLLVALDFDGTLSPLARRPHQARLAPDMRRLLGRLARLPQARLAFLSGRGLRDLARRIGLRGAVYSGNHGLEIRGPGIAWSHPAARAAAGDLRAAARALSGALEDYPGAFVENKGLTLSVHYREMDPGRAPSLRRLVARTLRPHAAALALSQGKKTWEVRPRADWNKGRALLKIIRLKSRGGLVLFAGDDRTDEEGFRVLGSRAVTVKVGGSGRTAARFRLSGHPQVRRLLELIGRSLS